MSHILGTVGLPIVIWQCQQALVMDMHEKGCRWVGWRGGGSEDFCNNHGFLWEAVGSRLEAAWKPLWKTMEAVGSRFKNIGI